MTALANSGNKVTLVFILFWFLFSTYLSFLQEPSRKITNLVILMIISVMTALADSRNKVRLVFIFFYFLFLFLFSTYLSFLQEPSREMNLEILMIIGMMMAASSIMMALENSGNKVRLVFIFFYFYLVLSTFLFFRNHPEKRTQ